MKIPISGFWNLWYKLESLLQYQEAYSAYCIYWPLRTLLVSLFRIRGQLRKPYRSLDLRYTLYRICQRSTIIVRDLHTRTYAPVARIIPNFIRSALGLCNSRRAVSLSRRRRKHYSRLDSPLSSSSFFCLLLTVKVKRFYLGDKFTYYWTFN